MAQEMGHPHRREGFAGQRTVVLPRPVVGVALRQRLIGQCLPTDVGYYPHASWHHVERPEGAAQTIFIYCVRGSGWLKLRQRRHTVRAGDLAMIPIGEGHAYGASEAEPWTIYWFHVSGEQVGRYAEFMDLSREEPLFFIGEEPGVAALFEEMLATLQQGYSPHHLLLAGATAQQLMARLAMLRRTRGQVATNEEAMEQVLAFMRENLAARPTVARLAAMANLSVSHFAAVFRRKTGYPAMEHFTRLKMQRACQLLDQTGMPIKQVAAQVGFADPLYFSRQFKKIQGLSPRAYRRVKKG